MQTYARQGGTSTIFVNDDGLRVLSREERDARIAFYANHGIGWVARPKHDDSSPAGFKRAGRFKKASNMNYALALSLKAEKHLADLLARERAHPRPSTDGTPSSSPRAGAGTGEVRYGMQYRNHDGEDQGRINRGQGQRVRVRSRAGSESGSHLSADASYYDDLEEKALQMAIDEVYEASGRRFRPWAANGRACRLGEIVLLVDSDTVVPEDCLRDAAREMAECPTVAIVQHESDVMQVAHHYFENGMAYFTRRIHKCISLGKLKLSLCSLRLGSWVTVTCLTRANAAGAANGEVAPFVGHNAFLRWKALQDAAFIDPADGQEKIWSESNVSEDFDIALRLQQRGYIIRWATYSNGGFKEGVSLTVDDELNRWQKYAYGE